MKILSVNTDKYPGNYLKQSQGSKAGGFEDVTGFQKEISSHIKSALPLDTIILPTYSSLEKISGRLSEILTGFFNESGISTDIPIDITADEYKNYIEISGDREDICRIKELVNSNEDLKDKVLTVNAIASHVCQMPEHLAFQKEYFESDNPEQVLADYSHLFNEDDSDHIVSFKFNSGKLEIYYDGKPWTYK